MLQSRAALSLLGYSYYQIQDFVSAADCYEQLTLLNPDIDCYRLYYAQSLYKASIYDEALKVSCQIDNPQLKSQVEFNLLWQDLPYLLHYCILDLWVSNIINVTVFYIDGWYKCRVRIVFIFNHFIVLIVVLSYFSFPIIEYSNYHLTAILSFVVFSYSKTWSTVVYCSHMLRLIIIILVRIKRNVFKCT